MKNIYYKLLLTLMALITGGSLAIAGFVLKNYANKVVNNENKVASSDVKPESTEWQTSSVVKRKFEAKPCTDSLGEGEKFQLNDSKAFSYYKINLNAKISSDSNATGDWRISFEESNQSVNAACFHDDLSIYGPACKIVKVAPGEENPKFVIIDCESGDAGVGIRNQYVFDILNQKVTQAFQCTNTGVNYWTPKGGDPANLTMLGETSLSSCEFNEEFGF